ncbi:MAG: 4-hydroxy-3-polyprenylbenzoate decarboxylase [Chloroflexi bacterium]|jgi:4-hydroxy-3-polyprenylbenzoate decarboxylase|nr:MAG: 4-hydroxy-3-polyprenylbenzoate decarboxylase [Chloroflexota bacterium]
MNNIKENTPVIVGITGASGIELAVATVDLILSLNFNVVLTISSAGRMVWKEEIDESYGETIERWVESGRFTTNQIGDLSAQIASGTYPTLGMAVVPCSMATVAAISNGLSDNLLRRAADVTLKEKRPLVIVPRETPLNAIHLKNMTDLAIAGGIILPPQPAFYLRQKTTAEVVDYIANRTVNALGLIDQLPSRMRYRNDPRNEY